MSAGKEAVVESVAVAGRRIDDVVRVALIVYSIALLVLAGGFAMSASWATALFPFSYASRGASYAFMAAILAAAAAPTLWCAITRDFRALVGGGIDAIVITLPIAIYSLMLGRQSLQTFALAGVATAIIALIVTVRYWRYPFRDLRPTPMLVRVSFVVFALLLAIPGARMAAGDTHVLPWDAPREVTVIYGWAFLGSAVYFVYGLIFPKWSNAIGQLLGTLAYDLLLIGPLLGLFSHVEQDRRMSLIIYAIAIVYSAAVATYYLLIYPRTRLLNSRQAA